MLEQGGSDGEDTLVWPDGAVFQRTERPYPAAFVQLGLGSQTCALRWSSQSAEGGEDSANDSAGDGHLGQLEGDRAGVAHDTCPDLDQLELQVGL